MSDATTSRDVVTIGNERSSGLRCSGCATSYAVCTGRILEHRGACCGSCMHSDTHDVIKLGTVPAPNAPQPGDWVWVAGQLMSGNTHPDDVLVEFFSHSDQWTGHVRADRIRTIDVGELPEFVPMCRALTVDTEAPHTDIKPGENVFRLRRCTLHQHHGDEHLDDEKCSFSDAQVIGYIEER